MNILFPLPHTDFDPTEVAVPWKVLADAGHTIVFATPEGEAASPDARMLNGAGLGPFRPFLRARREVPPLVATLMKSASFLRPLSYHALASAHVDALVLPGGHAPGMKSYLESTVLQRYVGAFIAAGKPCAAICHGVVLAARARHPSTQQSVLHGRRVTALLARQELLAWWLTQLWLGSYYRTYPETVQSEVTGAVGAAGEFVPGPMPLSRDAPDALARGFVVRDGNLVTARWPGDAYALAHAFLQQMGRRDTAAV